MTRTALRIASFSILLSGAATMSSCCKCADSGADGSGNSVQNPATPPGLGMCAWMLGKWSGPLGDSRTEEEWRREGDVLNGEGRTYKNGQLVFTEKLRIVGTETGNIEYIARPQGSSAPTAFTMTDSTATLVRFENKEHDFPKVIRYEFDGATKMHVHLEGHENGKFHEMDYTLERAR